MPALFAGAEHVSKARHVSVDPEIFEVACDALRERRVLFFDREVSMASKPLSDVSYETSNTRLPCLHPRHPTTAPSSPPVVREPEEIEDAGALPVPIRPRWAFERNDPSFVGMQS
jgi:hypothetical protein